MTFKNITIALIFALIGTFSLYLLDQQAQINHSTNLLITAIILFALFISMALLVTPKTAKKQRQKSRQKNRHTHDGNRSRRSSRNRRSESKDKKQKPPEDKPEPSSLKVIGDRETGVVKWFNIRKGYGFIVRDAGDEVFVHLRDIRQGEERKVYLYEGQLVEYAIGEGDKGTQAADVVIISEAN